MKLSQKLLEIQRACNYFKKDTKGYNFTYTAGTTILATVRAKMDELQVLCYPKILEAKTTIITEKKILTELNMVFVWRCAETDAELQIPWYAQGLKDTEQGIGNALTYAERYFLLKFFKIPTDADDPDAFFAKQDLPKTKEEIEAEKLEQEKKEKEIEYLTQRKKVGEWILKDKEGIKSYLIDKGMDPNVPENIPIIFNQLSSLKKQYEVGK